MIAVALVVLIAAPLVALVTVAVRFGLAAAAHCSPQTRLWRLLGVGTFTAGVVLGDIAWVMHSLRWAPIPLLTNLACGVLAVGALMIVRDREPRSGDHR